MVMVMNVVFVLIVMTVMNMVMMIISQHQWPPSPSSSGQLIYYIDNGGLTMLPSDWHR